MPRELLILRHAKSDWHARAPNDFERPLAKRGKKDAPRVGEWLYREGLIPDAVVSSPAERAKQTALKVCRSMDFKKRRILWEDALYEAGVSELLAVLARCPGDASTVLLVGHNPGLEELLTFLAGEEAETPDDGKLLPTAALARVEMPDDWTRLEQGCANLVDIIRPRKGG
jgi:phosphohistidine phosphatase